MKSILIPYLFFFFKMKDIFLSFFLLASYYLLIGCFSPSITSYLSNIEIIFSWLRGCEGGS